MTDQKHFIAIMMHPLPVWSRASPEVEAKARELCAADAMEPDMMTEGGYGPGANMDGNPDGTASYTEAEPFWSLYIDDAIEALKPLHKGSGTWAGKKASTGFDGNMNRSLNKSRNGAAEAASPLDGISPDGTILNQTRGSK